MTIIVNGRFLNRRVTGVERFGREILRHLQDRLRVVRPDAGYHSWRGHVWEQVVLPSLLGLGDTLWSPANTGPLTIQNQVLTVHDLSPLDHPEWFAAAFAVWYRLLWPRLVPRVKHIVVPSNYVNERIQARFSLGAERVTVVPCGVNAHVFHPGAARLNTLPERYILFVGSLQPRKNLRCLLAAWEQIHRQQQNTSLVITGIDGPAFRDETVNDSMERVLFTGYLPESALPAYYGNALALALPSLDEGFGLSMLEAMACGAPVIAARAGALPEVAEDAALFFDPHSAEELAQALGRVLQDEALRALLRARGLARAARLSWKDSAENLWGVLQG